TRSKRDWSSDVCSSDLANKWLSQSLHILNSNAKGGVFAERGAFDNDRDAEESYARADRITWLKPGRSRRGGCARRRRRCFRPASDRKSVVEGKAAGVRG